MAFLSSENIEEMAYPVAFNMDTFKSIRSYAGQIKYCREKLGKPLGQGSSRMVFPIDDEKVLKLAKNGKGIAQNETEDDWFLQSIGLFAKVYDCDENHRWIEMQLARKARPTDFMRFYNYRFDVICAYMDYVHSLYTRYPFHRDKQYDELFHQIENSDNYSDTIFYMLYEYMANTQLEAVGDLKKISSWGIVKDQGEESLVMIDYGLSDSVWDQCYAKKLEEMVRQEVERLLNEQYEDFYDSPMYEAYENVWPSAILEEFLNDKENGIPHKKWNLIPAEQYKNLLMRYMQYGENARIPERLVDSWINLICNNLVTLEYMTELAGHSSSFPFDDVADVFGDKVEGLKDYDDYSDFLESIGYYNWAQLPDGSDAISDYGIKPIADILNELSPTSTPEEKLVIINRCLDVIHCRGDLASTFIQGGRATCSSISGQYR